jgi:hypothetical protein
MSDHRHDDEGSKHLWNVGKLLLDCTVQYPRRLSPSYLPQWEPEISHIRLNAIVRLVTEEGG